MPGRRPWRRAPDFPDRADRFDESGEAFLGDVESPLISFGETGQRGFSEAWQDSTPELDGAAAAFASDEADNRGRDLDARSTRWKVAALLLVGLGMAGWFAYSEGVFDPDVVDPVAEMTEPELIAPDTPRIYEAEPTAIVVATSDNATALFMTSTAGESPQPEGAGGVALVEALGAGPVFWAGRTHIVVTGSNIDRDEFCVVTTLVSADLVTVDLAATGRCGGIYDATGDRVACEGRDAVMLEVWPFDPRAVSKPPEIAAIRFRVEQALEGGAMRSQRGTVALSAVDGEALLDAATVVGGAPGDLVTIDGHECTLLDRGDVAIQLLPS